MTATTPQAAFAKALLDFQATMPVVGKHQTATVRSEKGNYSYDYADLTDVTAALIPALTACGLSWTAVPAVNEHGVFGLRCSLLHTEGHREDGFYPLPDPSRVTPQQLGSAITYGRRYALCALTGVAPGGDDDDAAHASTAPAASPKAVTDAEWMADFDTRVTLAATVAEVRGLWQEATSMHQRGRLEDPDLAILQKAMTERSNELKGLVSP